jgi:hypothetical protein
LKKFKTFMVLVTLGLTGFMILGLVSDGQTHFTPLSLWSWVSESYPAVANFDPGVWTVSSVDGLSVFQSVNGQPTLFYSDFEIFNTEVEGTIEVQTTGDDDYIGFALGFQPGDTTNPDADYLLVDWKQGDQWFNFGAPSDTPGSWAYKGLAVSRVSGVPTADEFWGHVNFDHPCSDLNNGLVELARGATLGDTGWADNTAYTFTFEFGETYLRVYVNENHEPEIDIVIDNEEEFFSNGRIAFYNFSQASVNYEGYMVVVVNVGIDIKPGSDPNAFNNDGNGVIPVAILGSETFDVGLIVPTSVTMEGMALKTVGKADRALYSYEDVNDDGFEDLVVQIQDEDGVFEPGEGVASITGLLLDGRTFIGSDFIKITQ